MEKTTGKFVVGMASGVVVGATIGLLFAPNSGKENRRVVRDKAGSLATSLRKRCSKYGVEATANEDTGTGVQG